MILEARELLVKSKRGLKNNCLNCNDKHELSLLLDGRIFLLSD